MARGSYNYPKIANFVETTKKNISSLNEVISELKSTVSQIGNGGDTIDGDGLAETDRIAFVEIDKRMIAVSNYVEKITIESNKYNEELQATDEKHAQEMAANANIGN